MFGRREKKIRQERGRKGDIKRVGEEGPERGTEGRMEVEGVLTCQTSTASPTPAPAAPATYYPSAPRTAAESSSDT